MYISITIFNTFLCFVKYVRKENADLYYLELQCSTDILRFLPLIFDILLEG